MSKIILKTALITISALILSAVAVFSLWILISPQSMVTVSEQICNYSFAATCADIKYRYSGEEEFLIISAEDAILAENNTKIVKFCSNFVGYERFEEICREKDEQFKNGEFKLYTKDYRSYIFGSLSAAQYEKDDLDGAISNAAKGGAKSFVNLILKVGEKKDKPAAKKIIPALDGIIGNGETTAEDAEMLEDLKVILEKI